MGHDFFQIFPHIALGGRIPQEIGGMIGGEKRHAAKFEPLAAETRNGLLRAEQRLERTAPRQTMTFGWITSSWRKRKGEQVSTSSGSGVRFSGGRHLTTLQM